MSRFNHQRHKPPTQLSRPRELIVACPAMRSNVNVSRIVRAASCCAIQRMIVCGNPKIDPKIVRDGAEQMNLEVRRSLPGVLKKLRADDYRIVALEQTDGSTCLHRFAFQRRSVLVVGHERLGIGDETLKLVDDAVEIPVYGLPFSYNVATATAMALYEYCRQFPHG